MQYLKEGITLCFSCIIFMWKFNLSKKKKNLKELGKECLKMLEVFFTFLTQNISLA